METVPENEAMEVETRQSISLHDPSAHVHFSEAEVEAHDSQIRINVEDDNKVTIHLGFLQYKHKYEVRTSVPGQLGEEVVSDPRAHVKLEEIRPSASGSGHDLIFHIVAHKEKLLTETLELSSAEDSSNSLTVVIKARVLGKGKGTPSLKDGIHCIAVEMDEDDMSDWQGF